jgi:hypothetical protein
MSINLNKKKKNKTENKNKNKKKVKTVHQDKKRGCEKIGKDVDDTKMKYVR